jgi:hypothetical protein
MEYSFLVHSVILFIFFFTFYVHFFLFLIPHFLSLFGVFLILRQLHFLLVFSPFPISFFRPLCLQFESSKEK